MEVKAETEGFEPSKQFPVYTLSKRTSSATRAGLLSLNKGSKNKGFSLTSYWHGQHSFFLTHQLVDVVSNLNHILQTMKSKSYG